MAIIVRSPNWIGDCIMSLPALRALKDKLPGEDIYLAVKEYLTDVYENLDIFKGIITIPDSSDLKSTFRAAKTLREYRFDAGILFTNSFNSALMFKLGRIKRLFGYDKDLRGFLLHGKYRFPSDSRKHHIYFYLDLAAFFLEEIPGVSGGKIEIGTNYSDELVVTAEEKEKTGALLAGFGIDLPGSRGCIGISPSAAYGTAKQWPAERFGALIRRIREEMPDREVLLFGSSKEREKISRITGFLDDGAHVFNLAGRLSLREAITAISLCDCFVSNDSGLMHVASALRVPLAAIFGPTKPYSTGPLKEYNKNVEILYHGAECAPCLHRDCPVDHPVDHPCMKAVTVDEVFGAIRGFGIER